MCWVESECSVLGTGANLCMSEHLPGCPPHESTSPSLLQICNFKTKPKLRWVSWGRERTMADKSKCQLSSWGWVAVGCWGEYIDRDLWTRRKLTHASNVNSKNENVLVILFKHTGNPSQKMCKHLGACFWGNLYNSSSLSFFTCKTDFKTSSYCPHASHWEEQIWYMKTVSEI